MQPLTVSHAVPASVLAEARPCPRSQLRRGRGEFQEGCGPSSTGRIVRPGGLPDGLPGRGRGPYAIHVAPHVVEQLEQGLAPIVATVAAFQEFVGGVPGAGERVHPSGKARNLQPSAKCVREVVAVPGEHVVGAAPPFALQLLDDAEHLHFGVWCAAHRERLAKGVVPALLGLMPGDAGGIPTSHAEQPLLPVDLNAGVEGAVRPRHRIKALCQIGLAEVVDMHQDTLTLRPRPRPHLLLRDKATQPALLAPLRLARLEEDGVLLLDLLAVLAVVAATPKHGGLPTAPSGKGRPRRALCSVGSGVSCPP
mmetsp:Transcript_9019/g.23354  ORF Transcript_9019/g.23354 Transcript_9019/m.23354 type:complete len:309 (+) Transcript_9019:136-1062(+)